MEFRNHLGQYEQHVKRHAGPGHSTWSGPGTRGQRRYKRSDRTAAEDRAHVLQCNGVPIDEDKNYDYNGRFGLQMATESDKFNLKEGYTTAKLHFNRENRFYASLGFDGGIWYGQGKFDDKGDLFFVSSKQGQPAAAINL